MSELHNAFTLFVSLIVEAFPFLLLGVLLSSSLTLFIDEGRLMTVVPRNPILGAFVGSCVGFLFPVCECGNVPVARKLLIQGAPVSAVIGFLLAAPTINPIVIWSTWIAFRGQPEIVVLRVIFSLGIATLIGSIFGVQKDPRPLVQPQVAKRLNLLLSRRQPAKKSHITTLLQSGSYILNDSGQPLKLDEITKPVMLTAPVKPKIRGENLRLFLDNLMSEMRELGAILIIGSGIAACVQAFVPRELVLSLGQGSVTSILAMMLLAVVVSICSTVDSFFALSFASTFTTGSLLAFLVFGPMIDIKGVGLMLSIFKPRIIFYIFAIAAQLTFILTIGYSYLF